SGHSRGGVRRQWRSWRAGRIRRCRYLLRRWRAVTSILFGSSSPALAEGSAEPSATALIEGLVTRREPVGGPFDLIDHTGQRRTDVDFRGKLVVIYFGYTHCDLAGAR